MSHSISDVLLDEKALRDGVARLAGELDRDLGGRPVLLVGVLKGAVFFLADLARRVRSPVTLDFLRVSSYGAEMRSSGNLRVIDDLSTEIAGREVIVVEDIVDTGRTLLGILDRLAARNPKSLKVCALLRKKTAVAAAVPVDYLGFEIPDRFVVGYGLDCAEEFRNLPYIAAIDEPGQ